MYQWKRTNQITVLECVKHLKVTFSLTTFQVGNKLPEAIDTGQGHQTLRVLLPGVPKHKSRC